MHSGDNGYTYEDALHSSLEGAKSLRTVIFEEGRITIPARALKNCSQITDVVIPAGVTTIGSYAFYGCSSLADVFYLGTEEVWNTVSVGTNNEPLTNAAFHFQHVHTFGEYSLVKEPTCAEYGKQCRICSECGYAQYTAVERLPHSYEANIIPPTYFEQGYTLYVCSVCGDSYQAEYVDPLDRIDLAEATLSLEYTSAYYEGQPLTPAVSLVYEGEEYNSETELCISYANNDKAGTATVTVEGINRFSGTVELSFEISYESIPETIVNVRAIGDTDRITLSWAISSEVNTDIYRIYRKTAEDESFALLNTVYGRNNLSYVDTAVSRGVVYEYYVTGVGVYGEESEPSRSVMAQAAPDREPPVITKVWPARGTRIGGYTRLTAEATDNVGVARVVYEASADGSEWTTLGEASADGFGLSFDTAQFADGALQVRAVAYDAEGNASTPCSRSYTVDNTPPEKVEGLAAAAVYSSKLTLTWEDVPAIDRTGFAVQISDGGAFLPYATVSTIGCNVDGLTPETEYSFRVASRDACGNQGEWSEVLTVRTAEDRTPPTVTGLSPAPNAVKGILRFQATARDECGVVELRIQASADLENWQTLSTKTYDAPQTGCTWSCDVDTDEYDEGYLYLRAVAKDASGNSSPEDGTAAYNGYLIDRTAPDAPAGVEAVGQNGYITVSWTQGDENGLRYTVYRATAEDGAYTQLASGLAAINYHDRNVETDQTYWYRIAVTDPCGNLSEPSGAVSAQTSTDTQKPVVNSFSQTYNNCVSAAYPTVGVLATDNSRLRTLTVEYKVNSETAYRALAQADGINDYSRRLTVQIPVEQLAHGDVVTLRAYAVDAAGLRSDDLTAQYTVDLEAPELENLAASLDNDVCTLTWTGLAEADVSGYRVYRAADGGAFRSLGSRSAGENTEYTFVDTIPAAASHTFTYKVTAVDRLGNSRSYTTDVAYTYEPAHTPPAAVMEVPAYMEVGVEQYFDASGSTDDGAIVSFLWSFGDGTSSDSVKPVKKYTAVGDYDVSLTVTDNEGVSTTQTQRVEVRERSELGTLRVKVVDENYNALPNAKVLIDRGEETQCTLTTDSGGYAAVHLPGGDHEVAAYLDSGHLPAKKTVSVLANAERSVTLILVEEDLVTGEFEITRMDLDEIIAAGIDVYDPANQNIYQVRVRVVYGSTPLTIRYQRNDTQILSYAITDSNGNPVSTVTNGSGEARVLIPTVISYGSSDIVAILDIPAQVSYLKEFFDVKLYITNNAAEEFVLTDNEVTLNVPEGMTLMQGLAGYEDSSTVRIASIAGQETRTINWCLRGDTEGDYELSADYIGTLDYFDEIVTATFTADQPVKVYGMNGVEVSILACDEIHNGAFYFKIGLENKRPIDLYMPNIGLMGMVENVTESVVNGNEEGDFYVQSYVLNTYVEAPSGSRQYLPIEYDANGNVIPQVKVLAPGQKLVYEYVCYNAIKDDTVGYFRSAMAEVLSGYAQNVVTGSYERTEYSLEDYEEKLDRILSRNDAEINAAFDYIMGDENYYYVTAARDPEKNIFDRLYKLLNLGLDLDLECLTMEQERDLAQQLILQILLDRETLDAIDDQVMLDFLEVTIQALSKVKTAFMSGYELTSADYDDLLKLGKKDLVSLTKTLATEGRSAFKEELYTLFLNRAAGYVLADSAEAFYDSLYIDDLVSFDELVDVGSKLGDVLLDGLAALDSTLERSYIYSTLYAHASNEYSNYVLDAIIAYCRQKVLDSVSFERFLLQVTIPASELFTDQTDRLATAIAVVAREDKIAIRDDEAARAEIELMLAAHFAGQMIQSTAAALAKDAIKSAIGAPYVIAGVVWDGLDHFFGWGSSVKLQDAMVVYDFMASALAGPILAYASGDGRTEELDLYTVSLLKALCRMRLDGERYYRESLVMFIDREAGSSITEEQATAIVNTVKGTDHATLDDWYSELRYNILSARDILFNEELIDPVSVPAAPAVTLDYEQNQTVQSFSDAYEYCFADGVWIPCDGGPIHFTPRSTQTVLRVRVRATDTSLAGANKTVFLYAQKELSKLITVRRDGAQYILEHLKPGRTYQMLLVQPRRDEGSYDWTGAVTLTAGENGDAAVPSMREADQAVLRSCISDEDRETYSVPLVRTVARRQSLPLQVTGSGAVLQPRADGCYFFGETVSLTAVPSGEQAFEGWYIDGVRVSDEQTYLFETGAADDLEARFTGPQMTELIVTSTPEKLTYTHADALSLDGLVLTAAFGDGSQAELTVYTAGIDTSDFDDPHILLSTGDLQASVPITFAHEGEWIVQEAPTCTEAGRKSFTCSVCHVSGELVLEALDHDYVAETVPPTATQDGCTTYTCSRCGDTYTETIPATGRYYLVQFDANGGEGEMAAQAIPLDTNAGLTANAFTRTGYSFNGWNTAADGTGTRYADGAQVMNLTSGEAITLYAQWKAKTYLVRYNANGGEGDALENQRATYDAPFVLRENTFSRTGYFPAGWNTAADGSGTAYESSQLTANLTAAATVTLYAQFAPNTYDVVFNANGGRGEMAAQQMTYSVYSSLTPNAFTRAGYTFDSWNTEPDGTGTSYPDKRTVRNLATEGTVTLYAQWTRNTYTILFAANGGTGAAASQKATYNLPIALTANEFTRTGYKFAGWNTEADGSGTPFTDRQTVLNLAPGGTVKLYAQWKPNTYTIMFVTNGGSGSTVSQKTSYDLPTVLEANTFTRTGYYFYRWNTVYDGSGSYYTDGQTVTNLAPSGTFKLYAQWKPNKYTVTFDANGGSGTMVDQSMTYNTSAALRANTYTKTGYSFTGWNTAADGSGTTYANGKTVRNLATEGTVTLYAQWKANTITVRFYPGGGTGTMENQVMTYDVSAALSANAFYRDGYTFAGWKTGAGVIYTDGQVVENLALKGVVNLYAQWTR